jgi:hypothetical protein
MQGTGYCERLSGAFWAEPLNAVSNAAFLLAALAAAGAILFLAACFGLASVLSPQLPAGMRGSAGYAGFLIGLFGVALAARLRGDGAAAARIAAAGLVFALSLIFRSLDSVLCGAVPFGLHWGWHLLNGLLLYLLLRAAILAPRT